MLSPKSKANTERINVFLPPDVLKEVKEEAENCGLNVSAYVRMLIINRKAKK
jgi:predicted DNA binding CopG/RHH family protein